ncbi:RE1-silencing transcription factor-like [Zophobas morio]|uniref:RE1-silencing transcription factor-like n=1 Tax=Zophobas morio TaxID=2755281 RepID=UPI00308393EE
MISTVDLTHNESKSNMTQTQDNPNSNNCNKDLNNVGLLQVVSPENEKNIINIEDSEDEVEEDSDVNKEKLRDRQTIRTEKATISVTPSQGTVFWVMLQPQEMRANVVNNGKKQQEKQTNDKSATLGKTSILRTVLMDSVTIQENEKRSQREKHPVKALKPKKAHDTTSERKNNKKETTIVIEDSDKDDDDESNVPHKVVGRRTKCANIVKCKKFTSQYYKCMQCNYATGLLSYFREHLQSDRHKWLLREKKCVSKCIDKEKTTKNEKPRIKFNPQIKLVSEIIKEYVKEQQNKKEKAPIVIEDSDKEEDVVQDEIEVEENRLQSSVQEKVVETQATNPSVPQQTPLVYNCEPCRYTTEHKFYFEIHLQSEKHASAIGNGPNSSTKRKRNDDTPTENNNQTTIIIEDNDKQDEAQTRSQKKLLFSRYQIVQGLAKNHALFLKQPTSGWYVCDPCGYATDTKRFFVKHVKTEKHKRVVKSLKDVTSSSIGELKTEKWYKCELCNYITKQRKCIYLHFKSCEHIDTVVAAATGDHREDDCVRNCNFCNYVTVSKVNLRVHILERHRQPRGVYQFWCKICNYRTHDREFFRFHFRHTKHKVAMIQMTEKLKKVDSEMIVDEVVEDLEENERENVAESAELSNDTDWTEIEVIVEKEEEEDNELAIETHNSDENSVDQFLFDSCSLNAAECDSLQLDGLNQDAYSEEINAQDTEDWADVDVEEDTSYIENEEIDTNLNNHLR